MSSSKKNLTLQEKNLVAQFLFHNSNEGKLKRGYMGVAAARFDLNRRSVYTIWKQAKHQMEEGLPVNIKNGMLGVARRPKRDFDGEKLKGIKLQQRGTVRGLAEGLEVPTTTAWRWVKDGKIRPHTNAIKPQLSEDCKLARFKFYLDALHADRNPGNWVFKCMKHVVHIDEKWFYLTKCSEKYYLDPDEVEPYRSCQSKKFVQKIMFLCAVSRPIYNTDGALIFYGKIGMFPFTQQVAAKRKSKKRLAGTMETKAIDSITKEVIKACMINKVLPSIKAKWHLTESTNIVIQQDNARPHIDDEDIDFRRAASSDGFNIHLVCQPTNSPDLNINDLGWFRALQALQTKRASWNIDELVAAVMSSFTELDDSKLNKVFLSLQNCMIEILKVKGHNNYKLPHMKKDTLIREGTLPENLVVEEEFVRECVQHLVDEGEASGFTWMMEELDIARMHM